MAPVVGRVYGPRGTGTGLLVNPNGIIVTVITAAHVLDKEEEDDDSLVEQVEIERKGHRYVKQVEIERKGQRYIATVAAIFPPPFLDIAFLRFISISRLCCLVGALLVGGLLFAAAGRACLGIPYLLYVLPSAGLLASAVYCLVMNKGIRLFSGSIGVKEEDWVLCSGYPQERFASKQGLIAEIADGQIEVSIDTENDPRGFSGGAVTQDAEAKEALVGIIIRAPREQRHGITRLYAVHIDRFKDKLSKQRRFAHTVHAIGFVLLFLMGTGGPWVIYTHLHTILMQGKYLTARNQLQCLRADSPLNYPITRLLEELERRFDMRLTLRLLLGHTAVGQGAELQIPPGATYQLQLTPSDVGYVYIYLNSRDTLQQLFPHKDIAAKNPLGGGTLYLLPAEGMGFKLDQHPGKETLYVVASRWPSCDLETLATQMPDTSQEGQQEEYRRRLMERLQARQQAQAAGVRGIFYHEYSYVHTRRKTPVRMRER